MNKKLISIAVAAAMAAPLAVSADTTLYGRINNSLVYTDSDLGDDQWDVEDYASRLGVKGSEDLGNGMKAIYQIELQMETADGGSTSRPTGSSGTIADRASQNSGFGTRLGYVGLSSGWGTLAVGRQWTPYYGSVDKTDIFQIDASNQAYIGLFRTGDAIAYVSPAMGGFSAALAIIASNDENDVGEDFADAYNVSLDWNAGPFSVGLSYLSVGGDQTQTSVLADSDQWGIGASWKIGDMFAVIGQWEDNSDYDREAWAVAGQMFFGNNTINVKYGETDTDVEDLEETVVEWQHHLSKRTRVFATYDFTDFGNYESDRLGFGVRHDF